MRAAALFFSLTVIISCQDRTMQAENDQLKKENDSLKKAGTASNPPVDTSRESTVVITPPSTTDNNQVKAGVHPITLQWIGWNKPGEATLSPAADSWYTISGSQLNENREYLNIDGKIRRISKKALEFIGTVETRTATNNGGQPCIKKGSQRFFAKGTRTYFRMQNMENCEGGNLLDYVDIYPGTSGL